jgi:6-phosphogluconolactonase
MPEIIVAENLEELSRLVATRFAALANEAIEVNRRFTVALSGGSTPGSLYKLLASDNYRSRIDWTQVFFFFGDERFVLPDDPESNYRMARENLLERLDIPMENIFRWPTETGLPEEVAADYEQSLRDLFGAGAALPRFDLVLLGLGADGHTASLFPDSPALNDTTRLAVANPVDKLGLYRLTFTFPLINSAENIVFLVSGAEKAEVVKEILEGRPESFNYPAQGIAPAHGNLAWFLDKPASAQLAGNY